MGGLIIFDLVVEYFSGGYVVWLIDGLSFDVVLGLLVILFGFSGCGKMIFLFCFGGILCLKFGLIKFDDVDIMMLEGVVLVKYWCDKVGIVF